MMRSNKLNSDVDMLYGQLRSNFGLNWEKLQADLKSLDPGGTGYVSKDDLKVKWVQLRAAHGSKVMGVTADVCDTVIPRILKSK